MSGLLRAVCLVVLRVAASVEWSAEGSADSWAACLGKVLVTLSGYQ